MVKFLLIAVLVTSSGDEYASVADSGLSADDCVARLAQLRPVADDDGSVVQYSCVVDWGPED